MDLKSRTITFFVNGIKIVEGNIDPQVTLLSYLRDRLNLVGSKLGCGEGGCGACTVTISKVNRETKDIEHASVNACLVPVVCLHGVAVTTVEGIGSVKTKLHAVQERLAKSHGTQCGFCSPGMVMSMYTLLRNCEKPTMSQIETYLQGNLCRCTGYRPILEGFSSFADGNCCKSGGTCPCKAQKESCKDVNELREGSKLVDQKTFTAYDPSQDIIFPPELQVSDVYDKQSLLVKGKTVTFIRPTSLEELLNLKNENPDAIPFCGNTIIGMGTKHDGLSSCVLISTSAVKEMHAIEVSDKGITIGANNSLTSFAKVLKTVINKQSEGFQNRNYEAILSMIRVFGSQQIRNMGSIGGSIMFASPISDLGVICMSTGSTANIVSKEGEKILPLDEHFFDSKGKTALDNKEILVSICVPPSKKWEFSFSYKQARRIEFDRAVVNAGMKVIFKNESDIIENITLAYGGLQDTLVYAKKTMQTLLNKKWDESLVELGIKTLDDDFAGVNDPSGYKISLAKGFFFKFYLNVTERMVEEKLSVKNGIPATWKSATRPLPTGLAKSSQIFQEVEQGQLLSDAVGRAISHLSAEKHASGEAQYVDDIPHISGELYLTLVTSTRAHAKILSVDPSKALAENGVVAFYSAKDLTPEMNKCGAMIQDEEIFASEKVTCYGQVIGAVVALDKSLAQKAAKKVEVKYEDITPIITNIKDAIKANSINQPFTHESELGNVDEGFKKCDHVLEGEFLVGGQAHMYLETHACLVVPKEGKEFDVYATTQEAADVQKTVSKFGEVPSHKVNVHVRRLGGGFGGKASRGFQLYGPLSIAATRLNRPVRCSLDRDEDMTISGKRHDYLAKYKVGFNKDGKLIAIELHYYADGGNTVDISPIILLITAFQGTHTYYIPNTRVKVYLCVTNRPSNTSMRGVGRPQLTVTMENILHEVGNFLKVEAEEIRYKNFYVDGNMTLTKHSLDNCNIRRCWEQLIEFSGYANWKKDVEEFNKNNRYKKRGCAMTSSMEGVGFCEKPLCQAGCLINIYLDGSVFVTIGGVEMGQGLHTKICQVVSHALEIPIEKIFISETTTNYVPNATPTGGSYNTDLYGNAALNACKILRDRLKPYIAKNNGSWEHGVGAAYGDQVSLSTTGFWKSDIIQYSSQSKQGAVCDYYTYGAACSLVEIDCLTGGHKVLKTNIVMDVGNSISPAIDVGQIEGAFIQGYGMYMLEDLKTRSDGYLESRGPYTYKIPSMGTIPMEFNVAFLKNSTEPRAIFSSKSLGEPPYVLAASAHLATRRAIEAARKDVKLDKNFTLNTPATAEVVRLACGNQLNVK